MELNVITVSAVINVSIEKAWEIWNNPKHIMNWCFASPDWHAPSSTNDLRVGGKFTTRMEAKDKSFGFDFEGEYTNIKEFELIEYVMSDGRKVSIQFRKNGTQTEVIETFDPENENPIEMQKGGWQAILNSYKNYTESV